MNFAISTRSITLLSIGEEKQSNGTGQVEHNAEKSADACCLSGEGEGAEGK